MCDAPYNVKRMVCTVPWHYPQSSQRMASTSISITDCSSPSASDCTTANLLARNHMYLSTTSPSTRPTILFYDKPARRLQTMASAGKGSWYCNSYMDASMCAMLTSIKGIISAIGGIRAGIYLPKKVILYANGSSIFGFWDCDILLLFHFSIPFITADHNPF